MERFKEWKKPDMYKEGWTVYGWRCQYPDVLTLGKNVDIGCFTYMNARFKIEIGDDVQIGSHCSIYSHDTERNIKGKVVIGEGSLIGSHCLILPNAVISIGSKIRAYSIVKSKGKSQVKK